MLDRISALPLHLPKNTRGGSSHEASEHLGNREGECQRSGDGSTIIIKDGANAQGGAVLRNTTGRICFFDVPTPPVDKINCPHCYEMLTHAEHTIAGALLQAPNHR